MNINKMNTSKSRWINKKQIILQYKNITVANYSWDESNWLVYTSTIKMFQTYFYKWIISTREALYLCMNWRKAASFFTEMLLWVDREHMCMMVKLAVQKNKTHTGTISDCKNLRAGCGATSSQTKSLSACKLQESQAVNHLSVRLAAQRLKTSYSGCTHFSAKSRTWQHTKQLLQDASLLENTNWHQVCVCQTSISAKNWKIVKSGWHTRSVKVLVRQSRAGTQHPISGPEGRLQDLRATGWLLVIRCSRLKPDMDVGETYSTQH